MHQGKEKFKYRLGESVRALHPYGIYMRHSNPVNELVTGIVTEYGYLEFLFPKPTGPKYKYYTLLIGSLYCDYMTSHRSNNELLVHYFPPNRDIRKVKVDKLDSIDQAHVPSSYNYRIGDVVTIVKSRTVIGLVIERGIIHVAHEPYYTVLIGVNKQDFVYDNRVGHSGLIDAWWVDRDELEILKYRDESHKTSKTFPKCF